MNALTPTSLVHFYDTRAHEILCGVHGADHRSTKYARFVTCHSCVRLLGTRPALADAPPAPVRGAGAAS